ncbi:MAG: GNAT family N-acetyltransferase [Rhizobiaceae bacterium]
MAAPPLHLTAPVIVGERVILRPHRASDIDAIAALYQGSRAAHIGGRQSRATVWRWLGYDAGQWGLLGYGSWAVDDLKTGMFAGQVAINRPDNFPEPELGWLLFDAFEGRGLAHEAALLARRFAFEKLAMDTLVSYIAPDNHRSIKLAERLGAAVDPGALTPDGDACLVYRHRPD